MLIFYLIILFLLFIILYTPKKSNISVSLIITTYNNPKVLYHVIQSALNQNYKNYEIIIADDGSTDETKNMINIIKEISKIKIVHSWQEDYGFRAASSRNKAILKSSNEYIIMIDGDMILDKNFIYDHVNIAEKNVFIQGSRVLLNNKLTNKILKNGETELNLINIKNISNKINLIRSYFLSLFFRSKNNKIKGIRTCNFSLWKEDIYKVNGFNNDFIGWGREDSEFVIRLFNAGLQRKNLKFYGKAYHMYHPENSRKSLEKNDKLLEETINKKLKYCKNGLRQLK